MTREEVFARLSREFPSLRIKTDSTNRNRIVVAYTRDWQLAGSGEGRTWSLAFRRARAALREASNGS